MSTSSPRHAICSSVVGFVWYWILDLCTHSVWMCVIFCWYEMKNFYSIEFSCCHTFLIIRNIVPNKLFVTKFVFLCETSTMKFSQTSHCRFQKFLFWFACFAVLIQISYYIVLNWRSAWGICGIDQAYVSLSSPKDSIPALSIILRISQMAFRILFKLFFLYFFIFFWIFYTFFPTFCTMFFIKGPIFKWNSLNFWHMSTLLI